MVEADKEHFAECVTHLAVIHRQAVSTALVRAYWEDLKEMSLNDFDHAMKHLRRKAKWMPKPAEFWEARRAGWT